MSNPSSPSAATRERSVDVLGLGNMGLGMAVTLRAAGWVVRGFDPDPAARANAGREGIEVAHEIIALSAPTALLSLPGAAVVEQCVPDLLAGDRRVTVIDTTTSHPRTSQEMQTRCEAVGATFVDAPVSGGRGGAWSGGLTAFVGGRSTAVEMSAAVLGEITAQWSHLGASGSGNVVKLLNNMLCAANLASVAEAIDVLDAYGLDVVEGLAALNLGSGRSAVSQVNFADSILKGQLVGGFAVGLMARDVRLGLEVARAAGADPTLLRSTDEVWARALAVLGAEADCNRAPSAFTTATSCLDPAELTHAAPAPELTGAAHHDH